MSNFKRNPGVIVLFIAAVYFGMMMYIGMERMEQYQQELLEVKKERNQSKELLQQSNVKVQGLEEQVKQLEEQLRVKDREIQKIRQAQSKLTSRSNFPNKGEWMKFRATAYTARCAGCSGVTATGKDVRDTSVNHRVVAVDPDVIPLGSLIEIEGLGMFTASDTGGAIQGNRIDILMSSESKALEFGRQQIKVRVLRRG